MSAMIQCSAFRVVLRLTAVSILLLAGCGADDPHAPPVTDGALSLLEVSGAELVDQAGRSVRLRGFQGLGFYAVEKNLMLRSLENGDDPYRFDPMAVDLARFVLTDFDLSGIRGTGANVVRLWFDLHELQRQPGVYSQTALSLLEETIDRFGRNGIYVIPVLGGTGQNPYVESQFYIDRGLSFWDRDNGLWDCSLDLWRTLAGRLKDNPNVAGYDLLNEPAATSAPQLHAFYEEAIAAIRSTGDRHVIILEADVIEPAAHQIGGVYADENLVASFHFYHPVDFTLLPAEHPELTYPGYVQGVYFDRAKLGQHLDAALAGDQIREMPVYIGEFGADGARADDAPALRWLEDLLSLLNERDLHFTYHNYRSSSGFEGYWYIKPDVRAERAQLQQDVAEGIRLWHEVSDEEKRRLFTTGLPGFVWVTPSRS